MATEGEVSRVKSSLTSAPEKFRSGKGTNKRHSLPKKPADISVGTINSKIKTTRTSALSS